MRTMTANVRHGNGLRHKGRAVTRRLRLVYSRTMRSRMSSRRRARSVKLPRIYGNAWTTLGVKLRLVGKVRPRVLTLLGRVAAKVLDDHGLPSPETTADKLQVLALVRPRFVRVIDRCITRMLEGDGLRTGTGGR